jgi:hypothetical protein
VTASKALLLKLNENLNILREREARYGADAPLPLLNQIADHQAAIALTEQLSRREISETEWQDGLKPLLIAIEIRSDEASRVLLGDIIEAMELREQIRAAAIAGNEAQLVERVMTLVERYVPDRGRQLPPAQQSVAKNVAELVLGQVGRVEPRTAGKYPENPAGYDAPLRDALADLMAEDSGLSAGLAVLLRQFESATKSGGTAGYEATVTGSGAIAQGPGAVAAGQGGLAVGGDVQGNINLTGWPRPQPGDNEEKS